MSEYPEHDKLSAIKAESQAQGELLEWLADRGWLHLPMSIQNVLAEYHEIDLKKIETEKRAMLAMIRGEGA